MRITFSVTHISYGPNYKIKTINRFFNGGAFDV